MVRVHVANLMQAVYNFDSVVEDDGGFSLGEFLLSDDVVLEVDEVCRVSGEVVSH